MKFTQPQLEQAFIQLLQEQGFDYFAGKDLSALSVKPEAISVRNEILILANNA